LTIEPEIADTDTPRRAGDQLSKRGRAAVVLFAILGLSTFFVPLIKLDPPVNGRDHWSLARIVFRQPPELDKRAAQPLNFWKFSFAVRYAAILLDAIWVFFRPSRRALVTTSLFGLFLSGRRFWYLDNSDLNLVIYGQTRSLLHGQGANASLIYSVLSFILLLLIVATVLDPGE
jgi:hypothetical protein